MIKRPLIIALGTFIFAYLILSTPAFADCTITMGTANNGNNGAGLVAQDLGQMVTTCGTGYVSKVNLRVELQGTPSDLPRAIIEGDTGSLLNPNNVDLGHVDVAANGVGVNTTFDFCGQDIQFNSGDTFAVVLSRSGSRDSGNYFNWYYENGGSDARYTDPDPSTWNTAGGRTFRGSIDITTIAPTCAGGGGGGGAGSAGASVTSSIDQTQNNLVGGFYIYLASLMMTLWIIRKR